MDCKILLNRRAILALALLRWSLQARHSRPESTIKIKLIMTWSYRVPSMVAPELNLMRNKEPIKISQEAKHPLIHRPTITWEVTLRARNITD